MLPTTAMLWDGRCPGQSHGPPIPVCYEQIIRIQNPLPTITVGQLPVYPHVSNTAACSERTKRLLEADAVAALLPGGLLPAGDDGAIRHRISQLRLFGGRDPQPQTPQTRMTGPVTEPPIPIAQGRRVRRLPGTRTPRPGRRSRPHRSHLRRTRSGLGRRAWSP